MSEDNLYQTTFVKKWLKSNINYLNLVHMSNEELTNTALHFVEKEDFYGEVGIIHSLHIPWFLIHMNLQKLE